MMRSRRRRKHQPGGMERQSQALLFKDTRSYLKDAGECLGLRQ